MNDPISRRRTALRGALVAVLLAGTALGGYAAGDHVRAQEQTQTNQQGAITPIPPPQRLADFSGLVAQVQPAVVSITSDLRPQAASTEDQGDPGDQGEQQIPQVPGMPFGFQFRFPGPAEPQGHVEARGSGFIIDANGTVVTNNHVVANARSVKVTLSDGTVLPAKVVGRDPDTDIAVLKIDAGHPLPYLQLGNSDDVKVGEWVLAVGNPYGLSGTVTAGIVSARGRNIGGDGGLDRDYIQVDAPINRGNSGGPLLTQDGRVIGINTAILSPTGGSIGIGFAIPSNLVRSVVDQLEHGGKVVRGYLGVTAQAITPAMAQALGISSNGKLPGKLGALVADVTSDGPAAQAGIQAGDIIQSVNGDAVETPGELVTRITALKPGEDARLGVLRNGEEKTVEVKLGTRPEQTASVGEENGGSQQSGPHIGLSLAPLTPQERDQLNLPTGTHGVLIAGVEPGSAADAAGLQQGDVVLGVGEKPVDTPREAVAAIGHAREGNHPVALRIMRNGHAEYVVVGPEQSGKGEG